MRTTEPLVHEVVPAAAAGSRRLGHAVVAVPVAGAVAYLTLLVADLPRLLSDVFWNSDNAGDLVIAQRITSHAVGGAVTHASQPGYVLLNEVLAHLPAHRTLWMLLPFVMALATVACIAWSVGRTTTISGGLLAGAIALCVGPAVLETYLAQSFHGTTWLGMALIAVLLSRPRTKPWTVAIVVAITLALGFATASDLLLAFVGIGPLFAVGLYLLVRRKANAAAAIATALGATFASLLWKAFFRACGFVVPTSPISKPVGFTTSDGINANAHLLPRAMAKMLNVPNANMALTVVTIVLLAVAFASGVHGVIRASAVAMYWFVAAVTIVGAFIASDLAVNVLTYRYLVPVLLALAALVPIAATSDVRRAVIAVAVTMCIVGSCITLVRTERSDALRLPQTRALPALIDRLQREGLHRGYGDYWDAHAISWKTADRVTLLPVRQGGACSRTDGRTICSFFQNVSAASYRPHAGRSFVLLDTAHGVKIAPSRRQFGAPARVVRLGRFRIYEYDHDVGTNLLGERLREPRSSSR